MKCPECKGEGGFIGNTDENPDYYVCPYCKGTGSTKENQMSEKLPWKLGQRYATCGESDSVGIQNPKIMYYEVPPQEARELWLLKQLFTDEQIKHPAMKTMLDIKNVAKENAALKEKIREMENGKK